MIALYRLKLFIQLYGYQNAHELGITSEELKTLNVRYEPWTKQEIYIPFEICVTLERILAA